MYLRMYLSMKSMYIFVDGESRFCDSGLAAKLRIHGATGDGGGLTIRARAFIENLLVTQKSVRIEQVLQDG